MEAVAPVETRWFFALAPDEAARARIGSLAARLKVAHRMNGALIRPQNLHVSLYGFGDPQGYDDWLRSRAEDTARRVDLPPFEVTFDYTASFDIGRKRSPFVLRGSRLGRLMDFQRALGRAMIQAGMCRLVPATFTPHITLLYADRRVDEYPVLPIRWQVREYVLIRSFIGHGRHEHLASWPLRGRDRTIGWRTYGEDSDDLRHQKLRHDEEGARLAGSTQD
jgi:2'-5' RNA ligase